MKYLLTISCFLMLYACSESISKNTALKKNVVKSPPAPIACPLEGDPLAGKILNFAETFDPKFCNRDSLVEGDCNSGYLYFTPKGNVIYHYFCVNSPEDDYCIGKAEFNDKGLLIRFEDYYSCKIADDMNGPTLQELNSGKMEKNKFTIQLIKLKDCPDSYGYTMRGNDNSENYYYLVDESEHYSLDEYPLKEITSIKALQKY